jgi:hypothetical protein
MSRESKSERKRTREPHLHEHGFDPARPRMTKRRRSRPLTKRKRFGGSHVRNPLRQRRRKSRAAG